MEQLEQSVFCWVNLGWWEGCHHVQTQVEIHRMRCRAGWRVGSVGRGICQRWWWWRWLSRRRWLPRRRRLPWWRRLPWRWRLPRRRRKEDLCFDRKDRNHRLQVWSKADLSSPSEAGAGLASATGDSVLGLDLDWPARVADVAPHFVAHSSTNFLRQGCQRLAGGSAAAFKWAVIRVE